MYEKHLMIRGHRVPPRSARCRPEEELANRGLKEKFRLVMSGCPGFCEVGPILVVYPGRSVLLPPDTRGYPRAMEKHLLGGNHRRPSTRGPMWSGALLRDDSLHQKQN